MSTEPKYRIVRLFLDRGTRRVMRRGMSREAARAWCDDPESNSATATSTEATNRTKRSGPWADFIYEEVG